MLRTHYADEWSADELLHAKERTGLTVTVVLPARDEEATVAQVVTTIRSQLVRRVGLVDELVVMDSHSTDATAARARAAGATVVACRDVLPEVPAAPGKGEALWRSLFATTGDVLVFVDADLSDAGAHYVTGLLGPILTDPGIGLTKGFYDRPLLTEQGVSPNGGGRVTELVARPLLNLYWPELAGFVQPLAGEYAVRRTLLEELPFPTGYGVEIGMLIDLLSRIGLGGMAQVDLGVRTHGHQSTHALGMMAAEIIGTALRRLDIEPSGFALRQYLRDGGVTTDRLSAVPLFERPPASSYPAYRTRCRDADRTDG